MISNQLPNCSPSRIILERWTIWTRQSLSRSLRGSTKVKYPEFFPPLYNFWHCWHAIKLLVKWLEIHESIRSMIRCVFESTAAVHPEMQNPFSRAIYGVDVMLDSRFKPKILEVRLKYFPVWRLVPWISLQDIVRKPALNFSSWTPDCVFHKGTGIITIVGADCVILLVLAVRLSGRGFRRGASSAFFGFFLYCRQQLWKGYKWKFIFSLGCLFTLFYLLRL